MSLDLDWLASQQTIDLTTIGARSGLERRVEIWWFRIDGRFIITGTPGRRDWLANVSSNPRVTIHVGGHDIDAYAEPIADPTFRRRVMTNPSTSWYSTQAELERLVNDSPMIEVRFDR
jgi:deazaflavin-dependent oxidoreductase (nitroreductase family)